MRNLAFILIMVVLPVFSYAQQASKKEEMSNAELFSNKAGSLIKKEYIIIGEFKGIEIQVLTLTDLIADQSLNAVRIKYDYVSSYKSSTKIASLDFDELDGLIKSLKIMQKNIFSLSPTNYTEVYFRSRGGFETGCFFSKNKWDVYIQIEKYDNNSIVYLKEDDIGNLLTLLESAKINLPK